MPSDRARIGVTVDGHRDVLGIWAGDGGEGAKASDQAIWWGQAGAGDRNGHVNDSKEPVCACSSALLLPQ